MLKQSGWRPQTWSVFLALPILAGCATAAQRYAQQVGAAGKAAIAERESCEQAVINKPEYTLLRRHDPDHGQFTVTQLTDETIPSAEEARLLASRSDETAPCRAHFMQVIETIRPDLAPTLNEWTNERLAIMALLVERKITWAEASRRYQAEWADFKEKVAATNQRFTAQLQAENQAELNRRQAAANALMEWSAQQQMINSMNRPVVTNCNRFASSVNCTSY